MKNKNFSIGPFNVVLMTLLFSLSNQLLGQELFKCCIIEKGETQIQNSYFLCDLEFEKIKSTPLPEGTSVEEAIKICAVKKEIFVTNESAVYRIHFTHVKTFEQESSENIVKNRNNILYSINDNYLKLIKEVDKLKEHFPIDSNKECSEDLNQIATNNFKVQRGLKEYQETFGSLLIRELFNNKSNTSFLDAGAGEGNFAKDLMKNSKFKGDITSISFEVKKSVPDSERSKHLSGQFLEEISLNEFPRKAGTYSIITDLYGVLSYSVDPLKVLKMYHDLLKPGGKVFVQLGTGAIVVNQKRMHLLNFILKYGKGFAVGIIKGKPGSYLLYKKGDTFETSRSLQFESQDLSLPPIRQFKSTIVNKDGFSNEI